MLGSFNCFATSESYPQKYNPILIETIKEAIVQAESVADSGSLSYISYEKKDNSRSLSFDATKIDIKIPLIWYTESF